MKNSRAQPDLFDSGPSADAARTAEARALMRRMIDALSTAVAPPWKTEMSIYLEGGEFQRAMWLVPPDEAAALWAEYDAYAKPLFEAWLDANVPPDP